MTEHFTLPNSYSTRKTYNGEVFIYLGHEKIDIEDAFLGKYLSEESICETFESFVKDRIRNIETRNDKFQRFIFKFETDYEESAGFSVIGVRPETEKEIETRNKRSVSAKLAAKEAKKRLEIKERKELERLKKKYDAA